MEALTAVQVALLTIYDMCKAADRGMTITDVKLLEKQGGKSGRKLPQIENNMKIEASISLRRRDEEVKVHGEPDCWNLG